ncbi:ATP-binding protein [Clostridium sp. YIM B02505]|uniref:ATP-binding protein n=1 Tax=Clostridium yunnanense TaxID=2800325 RepID=A0ABS1EV03_9CLOT|nr:ATP-binding protein [Clostridium yunnanense]MBK1813206.1 ATP-binding protein [Clostridium yunnanense]
MAGFNRVIVDKKFLRRNLVEEEDISKSLSRFIDNSINARREVTTSENPCKIYININNDLLQISDNSGGIQSKITDKDIFRIGFENGDHISGLGIKKSFFKLGNKIEIFSNKKRCSRKFSLDLNSKSDELESQSENLAYDSKIVEGTTIIISDLEKSLKKELDNRYFMDKILTRLGRMYSKFIEKGELIILINEREVAARGIMAKKLNSCRILGGYEVTLYKGSKEDYSGIDLFINDFMEYERVKNREVKWNLLNEQKHTYTDCIVEISYHGDKEKFLDEKELLFTEVIKFIKDNKMYFQSSTIIIQYDMPIGKVEELKEYYDEDTAKAIGIRGFDRLYEEYLHGKLQDHK